jgi:hypothetical protein
LLFKTASTNNSLGHASTGFSTMSITVRTPPVAGRAAGWGSNKIGMPSQKLRQSQDKVALYLFSCLVPTPVGLGCNLWQRTGLACTLIDWCDGKVETHDSKGIRNFSHLYPRLR